jgi:preprotein translocase subunit SecD
MLAAVWTTSMAGLVFAAALVGNAFLPGSALADDAPPVSLQIRRAQREPAEGLEKAEVPGPRKHVIYLHPKVELTNADIAEATAGRTERGDVAIDLTLTDAGAKKLGEVSASHLMRPLAFLLNGQVVCAPTIAGKISRQAQIVGDFDQAEAERISDGIMGRKAP